MHVKKQGRVGRRRTVWLPFPRGFKINCQHFNKLCSACVYVCGYQESVLILYGGMFLYLGNQYVVVSQYLAVLFIFTSFLKN